MLQTFWEFGPTSTLLLEPLKTTFDKTQFLCDALILLCEPFTIKFKISFLNVILLLFPDIVKEFIEPFIIKVELLFWYV